MPSKTIVMMPGRCCQIAAANLRPCLLPSMKKLKGEFS